MTGSLNRRGFLASTAGLTAAGLARGLVTAPPARADQAAPDEPEFAFAFAHPGILHSAQDLDRMRSAVDAKTDPIWSGFQALAADSRSSFDYAARNTGQITTWGRGPSNFQNETASDAAAAYQNALMWSITRDVRHADKARDILDTWAQSLQGITGADGPLGASLQGFKITNAAELLRHTDYGGWDDESFRRCQDSLRDVWYPAQSGYALFANGNWDDSAFRTVAAIAVLCDDRVMFEDAMRYAVRGAGNGSVVHRISADGQGQESGRDQTHEQLALGLLADAAQLAWNQGIDLFGFAQDRILAGYEYDCEYNLGNDVPFTPSLDRSGKYIKTAISMTARGLNRPIYEIAYGHYVSALGKDAPYTTKAVFRGTGGSRFIEGYNEDHPGFGTLAYARSAPVAGAPQAAPGTPAGLAATNEPDAISLAWIGSVDPATATPATAYTVYRADDGGHDEGQDDGGGQYRVVAEGLAVPTFTDRAVTTGKTYRYAVTASNAAGTSAWSLAASATAGLPGIWHTQDVGAVAGSGSTTFDGERFVLEDGGVDIAGTADSFRIASVPLRGDGAITARIVHPVSSQYSKIGVMVRGTHDAGSPHAAMLIQGLPLTTWSGVWTTRTTPGGATSATGGVPVPPTQQQAITTNASFPISDLGTLPESATPLAAPYVEGAGDGYRLRMPYWVRIERRDNRFTGSISPDGRSWTVVGSTEIALGHTVQAGLALCSCLGVAQPYAQTGTGAFDNVSVSGAWTAPAPSTTVDDLTATSGADAVELAWSSVDLAARYTVKRAPARAGAFRTIARDVGPVGFGARTTFSDATGVPGTVYRYVVAKSNVGGDGPDSAAATAAMPKPPEPGITSATDVYGNVGVPFRYLVHATGAPTRFAASGLPRGLVMDAATGLICGTPDRPGTSRVLVAATNATGTATAELALVVGSPPPPGWSYQDVGDYVLDERQLGSYGVAAIRRPGIAGYDDDQRSFTVRGAGTGMNVNGQGMTAHCVFTQATGDSTFTARLRTDVTTSATGQAGLLILKSLSPFDQMAGILLTGAGAAPTQFIRRLKVAGSAATMSTGSGLAAARWLRISRSGDTFTAYISSDGDTWSPVGQDTITDFGSASYYLAMAVTSRDPLVLDTVVFDNVAIV